MWKVLANSFLFLCGTMVNSQCIELSERPDRWPHASSKSCCKSNVSSAIPMKVSGTYHAHSGTGQPDQAVEVCDSVNLVNKLTQPAVKPPAMENHILDAAFAPRQSGISSCTEGSQPLELAESRLNSTSQSYLKQPRHLEAFAAFSKESTNNIEDHVQSIDIANEQLSPSAIDSAASPLPNHVFKTEQADNTLSESKLAYRPVVRSPKIQASGDKDNSCTEDQQIMSTDFSTQFGVPAQRKSVEERLMVLRVIKYLLRVVSCAHRLPLFWSTHFRQKHRYRLHTWLLHCPISHCNWRSQDLSSSAIV